MRPARLVTPLFLLAAATPSLRADDLGGGLPASHGRVPRLLFDSWIPGSASALRFIDLPASSLIQLVIVSPRETSLLVPGLGTLVADVTAPGSTILTVNGSLPLQVPLSLNGATLVVQGLVIDTALPGLGAVLTDGTRADLFFPLAMIGNSRQSSNSLQVIDVASWTQTARLGNSEHGYITFSPDRRLAYVCEPGSLRNRVVVYDLTQNPAAVLTAIPVTGGIRYGCAVTRDGLRLYAPLHNGISIIDTNPASVTYLQQIGTFPTLITGAPTAIFTGPLHVAVTPDGSRLYIAYGENSTWPQPTHVGVVQLFNPNYPETLIPLTSGGVFFGFATRPFIVMSQDGRFVYTIEYGVDPAIGGGGFVQGFQNGALLTAISTATDTEVAAIPTQGYDQEQIAVDRMGRNVWVPQLTRSRLGEVLRIDVDRRSATPFTISQNIAIDPLPYSVGAGPKGVGVSPDGATVVLAVSEDSPHPPLIMRIDARTNTLLPNPLPGESLCTAAAVQQR